MVSESQKFTPCVCSVRDQKYWNLFACVHLTVAFHKEVFLLPSEVKENSRCIQKCIVCFQPSLEVSQMFSRGLVQILNVCHIQSPFRSDKSRSFSSLGDETKLHGYNCYSEILFWLQYLEKHFCSIPNAIMGNQCI